MTGARPPLNSIKSPTVSVLIPAKNKEAVIGKCLHSLQELNYPKDKVEMIVVDGRSVDRTAEIAATYGVEVVYDDGMGNCRAHGLNAGICHARGDFIAFTDADCMMEPDWLSKGLSNFQSRTVGGVGGDCLPSKDAPLLSRAASFVLDLNVSPQLKKQGPVAYIPGANSIYRASAIKPLFPIPEVSAGEDALLNAKLKEAGWQLLFVNDMVVWHDAHYSSLADLFNQMRIYGEGAAELSRTAPDLVQLRSWVKAFVAPSVAFIGALALWNDINLFLAFILILGLLALFFSGMFYRTIRSLRGSSILPLVAGIMSVGYSFGFLKRIVHPRKILLQSNA